MLSDDDIYLFNEGTHRRLYACLGAQRMRQGDAEGVHFAVWAPSASGVAVVGDFNGWDAAGGAMAPRGTSGLWTRFVPGVQQGARYKYEVVSGHDGGRVLKADPLALRCEVAPKTASVVWNHDYPWHDAAWMERRAGVNQHRAPMSIYEVHLGSWRRDGDRVLSYRELAEPLSAHVAQMGFTHVELMPVLEHPFDGSWGYQVTGYYAPTARYGTPQDFMALVDALHQRGIGVILDWVPAHFATDEHGLGRFDGSHLYEHADPRRGFHPDWTTFIFNYGRHEVRSFLISSALMWLDRFHIDALRVDGVASMLYLDYSREDGQWAPNEDGSNVDRDAVEFLRRLNEAAYAEFPGTQMIAEESTAWSGVSRPTSDGGLGFGFKWDMGWMHDTLEYLKRDPVHRRFHHEELTFRAVYADTENFILALSHDEVVHGKGSLMAKMPGDEWQQLANLRLLFAYMYTLPGKKLMFMGAELALPHEWSHQGVLDWGRALYPPVAGVCRWIQDINRAYRSIPALHELDTEPGGFEWVDCNNADESVLAYLRWDAQRQRPVAVVCNFTPIPRDEHQLGLPRRGRWTEVLNSDATDYGGSGRGNLGVVTAAGPPVTGQPTSARVCVPPLCCIVLHHEGGAS